MINYFELFGLEQRYDIDKNKLKQSYLKKQAEFHPDRAQSNAEKVSFLEKSMQLNDAYKVFMDDYKRAEYLLAVLGRELTEETSKAVLSIEELEHIWQDNEKLDDLDELSELYQFEKNKLGEQIVLTDKLEQSFSADKLDEALELSVKLKYLTNLVKNTRLKIKHANS